MVAASGAYSFVGIRILRLAADPAEAAFEGDKQVD